MSIHDGIYRKNCYLRTGVLFFLFIVLLGCGAQSVYVPVESVTQFDDRFSDTDLRMMADKMVQSLIQVPEISTAELPKYLWINQIKNSTSEFINADSIGDKIMVALLKTGKFNIIDRKQNESIIREIKLGQSGFVNQDQALKIGQALNANYILAGELDSIRKETRTQSLSYYKLTLKLTNCETTAIVWADEHELKKFTKKSMIRW